MEKHGFVGELFVKCELLRLNYEVYQSNNPSEEGWDLFVLREINNSIKKIKIQVKTIDWKSTNRTISGNFKANSNYDILMVVILNYSDNEKYKVFVIPKEDIKERGKQSRGLLCEIDKKIQYTNKTITFSFEQEQKYMESNYLWKYEKIEKGA